MSITAQAEPHSIATFIAEGGTPADLPRSARRSLVELLREIDGVTVDLRHEDPDDAMPMLDAIANPDPARPWWDQWELELTCVPLLLATVEDMLSLELL